MKPLHIIPLAFAGLLCLAQWSPAAPQARTLHAAAVADAPVIDGDLSDDAWYRAGVTGDFVIQDTGQPASQPTVVRALSDLDHLYLAFHCTEPQPDQMQASAVSDNIWGDDCIELNFDPAGGIAQIYQIRVNSIGTKEFLLRGSGRLDPGAIQAAARGGSDHYAIELAVPFSAVGITRSPQVGMRWRVNFERLRTVGGEEGDSWADTGGDWANPEAYGQLVIPGGPLAVEAVGHGSLSVGRRSGAFMTVANHSPAPRGLGFALGDVDAAQLSWDENILLARRTAARVGMDFPVNRSGMRTYRWTLRDAASGALLYSFERMTEVAQAVKVIVLYHKRELVMDVDTKPWGELAAGATVTVELTAPGDENALHSAGAQVLAEQHIASASLAVGDLPPGDYEVRAIARDAAGNPLGTALAESVTWPEPTRWAGASADLKVLNNFVTELLHVEPGARPARSYAFTNPREGWVFFASDATVPASGSAIISLDGDAAGEVIVHAPSTDGVVEAMRFLPAGEHNLRVTCDGEARLKSLTVRAVPELVYCQFQADPHVSEYGPYDWDFLQQYVLPHCNTIVAGASEAYRPYMEQWKSAGKRWIVSSGVPGLARDATVTADEAEAYWSANMGMQDPLADGVIADEFFGGDSEKYEAWTEALRRIVRNPRLTGKAFYPWCGSMYEGTASREFIQVVMDAGSRFAWERYLPEQPTEAEARAYLARTLRDEMLAWREAQPGCEKHMIVCFGYLSAPPESLNTDPGIDYKVWMDLQFNMLANDPAFDGLYGVMEYLSSYSDEENVRWAAQLYRHYCIEGKTGLLSDAPYLLPHLDNPDFADGLAGWMVTAAEPGSVSVASMQGYGWLAGRYPETSEGDQFLLMKRSSERPNVISQTIKHLQPGCLYSLKMYSADHGDLTQGKSVQQRHAVSITLNGVNLLDDKSFQHVFPNCYSHHLGPFNAEHRAWMNYHWRVFRAKGLQARITISDWSTETEPGGPIGQETMLNFVEVQPYLGAGN